eukprot:SAG31_NODE_477_length_15150_cov_13.611772_11_plen_434_part_00
MATLAAIATPLLCAVGASSTFTPPPGVVPSYLTPRLHWSTSHYRSQGDPTGPIKLGSTWHMFTDCGKGWCHAISVDGAVSWNETRPVSLDNGTGIGTGSWSVLPNGTAVGLYCAGGSGCRSLECIGVMTSDDRRLERITDHGVKLRMPRNLSGFRDPARPFLSKDKSRMCAVLGGGADDCSEGGNKWLLYCTPDLIRVDEWQYVSTLASEFARPYAPSGGESSAGLNSGCTGLVSCPDFFPLSTGPRDKDVWMLIGSYNTARSAWYPPSRWSIGAFDGTTFSATSSGILGGDSDYVRVVTFSFLCQLFEKYGTFIARCNALIEKVSSFRCLRLALTKPTLDGGFCGRTLVAPQDTIVATCRSHGSFRYRSLLSPLSWKPNSSRSLHHYANHRAMTAGLLHRHQLSHRARSKRCYEWVTPVCTLRRARTRWKYV